MEGCGGVHCGRIRVLDLVGLMRSVDAPRGQVSEWFVGGRRCLDIGGFVGRFRRHAVRGLLARMLLKDGLYLYLVLISCACIFYLFT